MTLRLKAILSKTILPQHFYLLLFSFLCRNELHNHSVSTMFSSPNARALCALAQKLRSGVWTMCRKATVQKTTMQKWKMRTIVLSSLVTMELCNNYVEYANEANRIAHYAENLYKLGTRLELSDPKYEQYGLSGRAPISHTSHTRNKLPPK